MDSKLHDSQAGHEFTLTAMLPALCGANLIYGLGMFDSGLMWDYAQGVLHNEMLTMIKKVLLGVKVDDEALAFEVIEQVGPRGEYLTHPHTFKNMRNQSRFEIFDRKSRTSWQNDGAARVEEKAYEKAEKIISTHKPTPLSDSIITEITGIFEQAEQKAIKDRLSKKKAK